MNVVVTGGGTIAPIDDVRHLANVSSGRFSAMIAEACLKHGASVWHIHTPAAQLPYKRQAQFDLNTTDPEAEQARLAALQREWRSVADQLHLVPLAEGTVAEYAASLERVLRNQSIDVAFLAMAVSDFEPRPIPGKLNSQAESIIIHALRTPKVIRSVRDWSPRLFLVGFKLLSRVPLPDLLAEAEAACLANRADLTVANDLQTLRDGQHTVHLVRPEHPPETLQSGGTLADRLVDRVFALAEQRRTTTPHPSVRNAVDG
ncbi:phosphopantothenate-cysteine ligase [Singulisphaera sp. GP187]|uniref:phosphopantothenoylcysteine decarboxylase domain-containing protein n=1 Tax=Singulisphaera sp. GP187 TaxID=1882752 RepID=UPI0009266CB6|nr:phosphopantothenoylcysteine decarboxylase [Singulisphaera sp. GP187]SIO14897.1 phosphopantothenate-cysteine ligase [Singulisphaera sp. GP187]